MRPVPRRILNLVFASTTWKKGTERANDGFEPESPQVLCHPYFFLIERCCLYHTSMNIKRI